MEADAICQWETIERHRLALVPRTFGDLGDEDLAPLHLAWGLAKAAALRG